MRSFRRSRKTGGKFRRGGGHHEIQEPRKRRRCGNGGDRRNLVRLEDIIKEWKRQIGSLQRQAGKARRYQAMVSDLKTLETHHAKRQWDALEEQRGSVKEELDSLTARQSGRKWEIERQEGEWRPSAGLWPKWSRQLDVARKVVNELRTRISNHETASFSIVSARMS